MLTLLFPSTCLQPLQLSKEGNSFMTRGIIFGMTHTYIKKEWMVLCEDVFQNMNNERYWENVMVVLMEDIMLDIELYKTVYNQGFYWPTINKDARKFILSCDQCQRVGNISRRNKCLWIILLLLNHLIVGDLTLWVLFLLRKVTLIYLLLLIKLLSG